MKKKSLGCFSGDFCFISNDILLHMNMKDSYCGTQCFVCAQLRRVRAADR